VISIHINILTVMVLSHCWTIVGKKFLRVNKFRDITKEYGSFMTGAVWTAILATAGLLVIVSQLQWSDNMNNLSKLVIGIEHSFNGRVSSV